MENYLNTKNRGSTINKNKEVLFMVHYLDAIKRPFSDIKKLLIGIIIQIIPIVNLLAFGYQLKCAKTAMKKNYKLPEWTDWGDLFVKGILGFIIGIVYFIPIFIIGFLIGGAALFQVFLTQDVNVIEGGVSTTILTIILLFLIVSYLIPAALVSFVDKNKFSAAFYCPAIFKKVFTGRYFVAWLLVGIYGLVVSTILGFIPYVGAVISTFIVGVTFYTAIGEVCGAIK
jgi:hypothetical protein